MQNPQSMSSAEHIQLKKQLGAISQYDESSSKKSELLLDISKLEKYKEGIVKKIKNQDEVIRKASRQKIGYNRKIVGIDGEIKRIRGLIDDMSNKMDLC
ncbi:unnamed protein product [Larinioides sclopetarius]|uniref:Uncharacterized protein n=1 Tax=Larinioides sclopetarius TaxID=280406 RepID=A0AAV2BZE7_9ARAC